MKKQLDTLKKQIVLECASKYFRELGYEKTCINKISKELQVGVGTIYSFFNSKEGLYIEHTYSVIKEAFENIKKELEFTDIPLKKLEIFIRYKMNYFEKNREILSDYINNNFFFLRNTSRGAQNPMREIYALLSAVIKEVFEADGIKCNDYLLFAHLLDGIINSFIERYTQEDVSLTSKIEDVLKTFLAAAKGAR
jgi:AcrR family transcriptional regulator